jgi:uncharacterized cupredoxin-like copper-binding protein
VAVIATVVAALGIAAGAGLVARAAGTPSPRPGLRTIAVTIHFSRFSISHLDVAEGTLATFVVHNTDPIDHELIIGDQTVQDSVEAGTELHHNVPGQISVPAGSVVTTMYFFGQPGALLFGCHLPGHFFYGMRGTIKVLAGPHSFGLRPRWCNIPRSHLL